jgi:hypothetical protein
MFYWLEQSRKIKKIIEKHKSGKKLIKILKNWSIWFDFGFISLK